MGGRRGLLSRLFCGCLAPPVTGDGANKSATGEYGYKVQQTPHQPDSPPVKPRAPPAEKGTTIEVHADAAAGVPVHQQEQQQEGTALQLEGSTALWDAAQAPADEGSLDAPAMLGSNEPPQAPTVQSAGPRGESSEGSRQSEQASYAPSSSVGAHPSSSSGQGGSPASAASSSSRPQHQEEDTDVVGALRKNRLGTRKPVAGTKPPTASPPGSPVHQPRSALRAPPPGGLAAALANLATSHPVDPVADMNVVRAAAVHNRAALEPQLGTLVPLLLRTMRAPRLGTARAAILTFRDLFATEGLGAALCAHVADDTNSTSSAVLALMQKATGGDLNSKRISADANACLCTMVELVPPMTCIEMLQNYAISTKMHVRVRAKAGALVVAAAYRLAVTDVQTFDKAVMSKALKIAEALLLAGAACRQTAKKLAVVVYSAFSNQPHMHMPPPGSPRKGARAQAQAQGEGQNVLAEAWAEFVRLQVEPEGAAAIHEAVTLYGAAGQELVAAADLDGFALGHPVKEVVARLVLASD